MKTITIEQIAAREAELKAIPMGPERWEGDFVLSEQKAACPEYRHESQSVTFVEWLKQLAEASKETVAGQWDEEERHDYYEGQPTAWLDHYESGYDPDYAIAEDKTYWSD